MAVILRHPHPNSGVRLTRLLLCVAKNKECFEAQRLTTHSYVMKRRGLPRSVRDAATVLNDGALTYGRHVLVITERTRRMNAAYRAGNAACDSE